MPFHTYVLISAEGFHYRGSCADLNRRLENHLKKITHSTKNGTNWRLIYAKEFTTRSDAVKYEE
jgi:putative endonuclease